MIGETYLLYEDCLFEKRGDKKMSEWSCLLILDLVLV